MTKAILLNLAAFALLTSACGTSNKFSRGEASGREAPAPPLAQGGDGSTPGATRGGVDRFADVTTASTGEQADSRTQAPTSPLLIYNSSISLEATEADTKTISGQIIDKAKGFGGYMSQRSSNMVTVRIPAKEFYPMNDFIKTLAKVKYENATAQDVTMQYSDLKIRLDVQLKMLSRYQDLLKRSANVKEAVEVERELSRITERVEQLKGQIRYYDSQIGFSTISVSFQEPHSAFAKETKPGPLGWVFYGLYVGVKWLFVWD